MIERIYIKELTVLLSCRDIRSVKRWLGKNQVAMLSDFGCTRKYVIKAEFETKFMSQSIKYIQTKYGKDKLSELLNSSMKFFSEYQQAKYEKMKNYKPKEKYQHENRFLTILQSM